MTAYAPTIAATDAGTREAAAGRGRTMIIGATLAVAAAIVAAVLAFRPWPARNTFDYELLAPIRDSIWTAIVVDALASAAIAITLSLATCLFAQGRGGRIAVIGTFVTTVGGLLFAMGSFGFAGFTWYVTDPVLPAADGARLLDYAVANPDHLMLVSMLGFLVYTLGTLVLAAALFRSGAVPKSLPIALIAGTVAQFGFSDRALDIVQIVLMGVLVVVGLLLMRRPVLGPRP